MKIFVKAILILSLLAAFLFFSGGFLFARCDQLNGGVSANHYDGCPILPSCAAAPGVRLLVCSAAPDVRPCPLVHPLQYREYRAEQRKQQCQPQPAPQPTPAPEPALQPADEVHETATEDHVGDILALVAAAAGAVVAVAVAFGKLKV